MRLQAKELLALQALDTEIGKLHEEMGKLERGERVERALAQRQARLEQATAKVHALEAEQRNTELELRSLEEKRHDASQVLYSGRIKNPRELQALELEIASLDRQRQRLDETILRRMDELETARKAMETAAASAEEAEKALRVLRRRYERDVARIEEALSEKQPARERLAAEIAADILRRYDDLRRRNHNLGAVRVENGACSGCRMKIGSAVIRRLLTADQYVFCESCSRYLFQSEE